MAEWWCGACGQRLSDWIVRGTGFTQLDERYAVVKHCGGRRQATTLRRQAEQGAIRHAQEVAERREREAGR